MVIDLVGHRFFFARWFEDGREDAVRALSIFEETVCGLRLPRPVFAKGQKTAMPGLATEIVKRSGTAKGFEGLPRNVPAFFKLASIRLMLRRLCAK